MNMDRTIFEMNLGVEATSLYILTCALVDQGESATLERIRALWNGSDEGLLNAAEELIQHGIINGTLPVEEGKPFRINRRKEWRRN